jgi:superfamily II DNA/RNA helicase
LAATGSGKTAAFGVGSVLRVNKDLAELQVIVVAHSRELCIQIHQVYEKIVKNTGVTVDVIVKDTDKKFKKGTHILVTTHGSLKN